MNKQASFAFFCLYLLAIINTESKMIPVTVIRDFSACDGVRKLPFHLETITVNITGKGSTAFGGHIAVDENIDHITLMEIKVEKCDSVTSLTCEFYSSYKFTDPCRTVLTRVDGPWSVLFNTKPSLSCPIKKGTYALIPSTVKAMHLPKANIYWKFSMKVFVDKRLVGCIKGGIEKVMIRYKSTSKTQRAE